MYDTNFIGPVLTVEAEHSLHGHKTWEHHGAGKYSHSQDHAHHAPMVVHDEKPDTSRDYDIDRVKAQAVESQDAYHKRLKAQHKTACKLTGLKGVDAYNRVTGESELSDEILAVLASPVAQDPNERKGYQVTNHDSYDEAVALGEAGATGSYIVEGEACWSDFEYENEGKFQIAKTSGFNADKYNAKQAKLAKRRAYHDIPEFLDSCNRVKTKPWTTKRFTKAIETYMPEARAKSEVTDIFADLSL